MKKGIKITLIIIILVILAYIIVALVNLGFIPLNIIKNDEAVIKNICLGAEKVYRCGGYYNQMPDQRWADVPYSVFSLNGKFVTYCGGMPGPSFKFPPIECIAKCNYTNLCSSGIQ